jgi:hypothetical protein
LEVPVLLLGFNRPDLMAEVVASLRQARPKRLYVAVDGPRSNRPGEDALCSEVARIATTPEWPCTVETRISTTNQGCRRAVSSAISWFFENVEEGIILEDDCVPSPDFFRFCADMLSFHRGDERVMAICGSQYIDGMNLPSDSYYFSYFADLWGWATWRRAWRKYDSDMQGWPAFKAFGGIEAITRGRLACAKAFHHAFDLTFHERIDSWGYPWIFSVMAQGALACYPTRNLISNLGFRGDATHTIASGDLPAMANRLLQEMAFPLKHPPFVARCSKLDEVIEEVRLMVVDEITSNVRGEATQFQWPAEFVASGFHGVEPYQGGALRWTDGCGRLSFDPNYFGMPQKVRISLWDVQKPNGNVLEVKINGKQEFSGSVAGEWSAEFSIPSLEPVTIDLMSNVYEDPNGGRKLGIAIRAVEIVDAIAVPNAAELSTLRESNARLAVQLAEAIAAPNSAELSTLRESNARLAGQLAEAVAARDAAELSTLHESNARLAGQLAEVVAAREALLRSASWRLTAPLRNFYITIPRWLRRTLKAPRRRAQRRAALAAAAQQVARPTSAEPTPLVPEEAPAFDYSWYLATYPDVAAAGVDPYEHYKVYEKAAIRQPLQRKRH